MTKQLLCKSACAAAAALLLAASAPAQEPRKPSTPEAEVYIVSPADGAVVSSPGPGVLGRKGMGGGPAGHENKGTGPQHQLVDTCLPDLDKPVPASEKHIHFGGGQTETELDLEPGEHTLTLLLADFSHVPHKPAVYSKTVTITVE
ncbi:MAG: DUF4399 domain-containing protein [Pseudomonadota bacterium]